MADKKLRFTPLSKDDLDPRNDEMLVRSEVAKRWDCSEKSVIRAETRLGLRPCRFMREVRYKFSDILRIEREGFVLRGHRGSIKAPELTGGHRPADKMAPAVPVQVVQLGRRRDEPVDHV